MDLSWWAKSLLWLKKRVTWGRDVFLKERDHREGAFKERRNILKERLARADSQDDKAAIEAELRKAEDEELAYHARVAGILGKEIVEARAPAGAVSSDMPALPAPEQKALEQAASAWASADETPTAVSHFLRGNAFYKAGDFQSALAEYGAALRLEPDHPDILYNRGTALNDLERYEGALADFNRSLELRPNNPDILTNRGIALKNLKRHEEALADYNRSLELRPDHPDTLNNRGITLRHLKRYDEALADYNRSLELRPDDPATLNNRGNTLAQLKRYDEAFEDYNRSLELRPDHPATLYNKACAFALLPAVESAVATLERAIELNPKNCAMAKEDSDFDAIRDHPLFKDLMDRKCG